MEDVSAVAPLGVVGKGRPVADGAALRGRGRPKGHRRGSVDVRNEQPTTHGLPRVPPPGPADQQRPGRVHDQANQPPRQRQREVLAGRWCRSDAATASGPIEPRRPLEHVLVPPTQAPPLRRPQSSRSARVTFQERKCTPSIQATCRTRKLVVEYWERDSAPLTGPSIGGHVPFGRPCDALGVGSILGFPPAARRYSLGRAHARSRSTFPSSLPAPSRQAQLVLSGADSHHGGQTTTGKP